MDYHERLRIFIKSQGDSQTMAGTKMGYGKSMFSQYLGGKEINIEFVLRLIQAYPEVDLNHLFKGAEVYPGVNEPAPPIYSEETTEIIEDIEEKLKLLKEKVTHK